MLDEFRPAPWLRGPHLQTIVGALWPARPVGPGSESLDVEVAQGSAVRVRVDRPPGQAGGTLLLIHGMCGSAESSQVRRIARVAVDRGWIAARMNLRNCGGTEALSRTLYNAGQSDDIGRVLHALDEARFPRPYAAVAFSLGGNLLLRYAGRSGEACSADEMVAINPPIDLEHCVRTLELPRNRVYQLYYTARLCRQQRKIQVARDLRAPRPTLRRIRSIRNFDASYTAPDAGHPTAEAYYAAASAGRWLEGIRRPTLILSAEDDPFVPVEMFRPYHGLETIRFLHPSAGGHCGYLGAGRPRFRAAEVTLAFLASGRSRAGNRALKP